MVPNSDGTSFNRVAPDKVPANRGGRSWDGTKKWPNQTPPWGEILAVNVNTGDIAWREPLGSFEELDALGAPKTGTPEPRGGAITTAGGVLVAAGGDGRGGDNPGGRLYVSGRLGLIYACFDFESTGVH
jgi:quinoprotein glucose dehydrogenase